MRVQLLGVPTFISSEGDIRLPPKIRLLAAYLFYHTGGRIPRAKLAGLFWPEANEQRASASLRNALHTLQSAFSRAGKGDVLRITRDTVCATDSAACEVDARRFEIAARAALSADDESDLADLVSAVTFYRGELLSGTDGGLLDVEAWCLPERERLRNMYTSALSALVKYLSKANLPHAALDYAVRWRDADPLSEEASGALMRLYGETGQPARVAEEYERCHIALRQELGVSPSEQTVRTWKETSREALRRQPAPPEHIEASTEDDLSTDPVRNAHLLMIFGEQKALHGETEKGMAALERARATFERTGDEGNERRARLTMAGALLNSPVSPRPDLAIEQVTPLLASYREQGPPSDLGRALLIAADALQTCGSYLEGATLAREGLELARSIENRDMETRFNLVRGLALTYQNEFEEATEAVEAAITGLGRLYQPREMLRAMMARGTLASLNETQASSEQYYLEALSIAAQLPRTPAAVFAEGFLRGMLIILYWGLDRHDEARAVAFDGGFDLSSMPGGNVCLAICLPSGDPVASVKTADRMLRESLPTLPPWPAVGYSRILWQQMNLLGLHHEALPWTALNIRLARHFGLTLYEGTGYSTRGITLIRLGNLRAAEACLPRARALLGHRHHFSMAYYKYLEGLIAQARRNAVEARSAFEESVDWWRRAGEVHFVRLISEDMARLPAEGEVLPVADALPLD